MNLRIKENLEIIKEIVGLSVEITAKGLAKVEIEYIPNSDNLYIRLDYGTDYIAGMTEFQKTFRTRTSNKESLEYILKELKDIESKAS